MSEQPKFIQICSIGEILHALDEQGGVWKYVGKTEHQYAFWTKLTEYRLDGTKNRKSKSE